MSLVVAALMLDAPAVVVGFGLFALPHALAFSAVGAVLGWRRPRNPIGWLFASWGLVTASMVFATSYVSEGLAVPGSLPGLDWVAWAVSTVWHPAFVCLVFTMLLFPDGRLPSRRWRPFAWLAVAFYAVLAVSTAFSTAVSFYFPGASPPFVTPAQAVADHIYEAILGGNLVLLPVALVALVLRLRHSTGDERQQVKWFVFTVVVAVAAFVAGVMVLGGGYLYPLFAAIPVAAGVAIVKYRLYEIDRIISRTMTYGVLTALLGAVYLVGVVVLGQLFAADSQLAVAGSTLAVAALFGPLRRWVQRGLDRRFNRARYDAAQTVEAFRARLRDDIDLDTLSADLVAVVGQTVQPARLALWLRPTQRPG